MLVARVPARPPSGRGRDELSSRCLARVSVPLANQPALGTLRTRPYSGGGRLNRSLPELTCGDLIRKRPSRVAIF